MGMARIWGRGDEIMSGRSGFGRERMCIFGVGVRR